MKRLQIMIEQDLDAALERESSVEGVSKAAIIRRVVRDALLPLPPIEDDPLARMIGVDDFEPTEIDAVVYR